jgi:hypothetical protein
MFRILTCAMFFLAVAIAEPSLASPPEKFAKECVKTLSDSQTRAQRKKSRSDNEAYCQCVADGGQRLGLSRHEFAVERVRLENGAGATSGGRIRQISAKCQEDLHKPRTARTGF